MKKKRNYMHKSNWWKYLLAVVIVIFHVLPLYVLVVMAFKTKTDVLTFNDTELFLSGQFH